MDLKEILEEAMWWREAKAKFFAEEMNSRATATIHEAKAKSYRSLLELLEKDKDAAIMELFGLEPVTFDAVAFSRGTWYLDYQTDDPSALEPVAYVRRLGELCSMVEAEKEGEIAGEEKS